MSKITIEIDEKYRESLDLLKQVIPDAKWEEIKEDADMVWALIDSFMAFIQEQASNHAHEHDGGGCCGGGWHEHKHEDKEGWCCSNH